MSDFLLEIGCEEIPDWMIAPALDHLSRKFTQWLGEAPLGGVVDWVDATPRRLVLRASGLAARQADVEEIVTGPPKSAGAGAAAGFAKKMSVAADALETVQTPKGEYFGFRRKQPGRAAAGLLGEALPNVIIGLPWPKTMYWTGKGGPRFIRPIRWVVALLDDEIVPFEVAGVKSGNVSSGHRRLGAPQIPVTIASYEESLRANHVLVRAADRRARITAALTGVKSDAGLLDTLVYLTEFPTPVAGSFDPSYLALPEEVLVTVMRHHQKYFSCVDADGNLAPRFVAVTNTDGDPEGLIRAGNERVLRARFNDARFFWETDQKKRLADRVGDLANVTWQARLGSYLEKTRRVVALVEELGGDAHAQRAALLAKCDLTAEMVKEFTELQGVIGGLYSRAQGEHEEVAVAIYDHYKPVSMEDSIPRTQAGRLVSIADKLDTLRGCFRIGMIPSGSRDPFALRRAAQGIVKILVEGQLSLSLAQLVAGDAQLEEFLLDRVRYYFRDIRGFAYDEVNAVLAAGRDDLVDVESRLVALQQVRPTADFEPLAASFKRIRNILLQARFDGAGEVAASLLAPGPEADLHAAFESVRGKVDAHRRARDYGAALELIAGLRPKVDLFFDKVLVNAPDEAVRRNRLTLLSRLLTEFSSVADFSEIVTSKES
jgi:glycyl-tRNA synthetase beta chain